MTTPNSNHREIKIKIPQPPKDKVLWIVGGTGFLIAFLFGSSVLKELNDLKKQQTTTEDRIKQQVLMPGGTTEYKTEFKPDPSRDTAKDAVTEIPEQTSQSTKAIERPAVAPTQPSAIGPGNLDTGTELPYSGAATGPGNM